MKTTLGQKLLKGLTTLALSFGLLSITDVRLGLGLWTFLLLSVIFLAGFWHLVERMNHEWQEYTNKLDNMQKDINYIKQQVDNMRMNRKGQWQRHVKDILIGTVALFLFWVIISKLFF
ncbi:hypothetical protein COY28_01325 [Candidatus Woesearchaeota archaeon CG_4_10_14_0_2_um_filter_57_5]|nr:MAG: hypothetical protein AUJ68_05395 [Candidatus Woesearchaeota archaeon CG1_02_57_44]PIZ55965.1 MAG: hypothetical protein COY28_01325 [Candidatus Woesearchaeota archaeon CG_4_10_14_0_2_um_filter_57_5]